MRRSLILLAGLFLSATLPGCGGSATIPAPPSTASGGPPPGTSDDMLKAKNTKSKGGLGGMAPAKPDTKR
jgi:hypothetical protein